jgi:hypothetical protein
MMQSLVRILLPQPSIKLLILNDNLSIWQVEIRPVYRRFHGRCIPPNFCERRKQTLFRCQRTRISLGGHFGVGVSRVAQAMQNQKPF